MADDTKTGPKRACFDCRRLKLKCSRTWPCTSCTRRKMSYFCPKGQSSGETAVEVLSAKVAGLEAQLDQRRNFDIINSILPSKDSPLNTDATSLLPSPSSSKHPLESTNISNDTLQFRPVYYTEDATPGSSSSKKKEQQEAGNAGLLIIMNDGESSTYVGGGATSAHRVEIESEGTESTTFGQNFVQRVRQSLPLESEAKRYCDIYFMHGCVEFSVLSETSFYSLIYSVIYSQSVSISTCTKQEWAIFYLIVAIGCHFDPVSSSNDQLPHTMFAVARSLLDPAEFEDQHSKSSVRALLLMGIFSANARARGSERNWAWLGIQMRIVQAMGLHRDGALFHLSEDSIENRRRLFWECQTFDRLHSLSLGRPYAIADSQIDTLYPKGCNELETSFQSVKFQLGKLRGKIFDELFSINSPLYSSVLTLDKKLRKLEQSLHPLLRFTGGISHDASIQIDSATKLPDIHTMRSLYLSILLQETTMCLHRSHFAKAIIEQDKDPLLSAYCSSVVAVMDAARRLISCTISSWNAFPSVSVRWAFLWIRSFSAGVCIGACISRFPDSVLTMTSLGDLIALRDVFTLADKHLCKTERPLTKWVLALDTICMVAEGRSAATTSSQPSLDLLRGTTHLSKRQRLESNQDTDSSLWQLPTNSEMPTSEQSAMLDIFMRPNMEEYIAQLELSWSDLFPPPNSMDSGLAT